jgi:hypothetical protein
MLCISSFIGFLLFLVHGIGRQIKDLGQNWMKLLRSRWGLAYVRNLRVMSEYPDGYAVLEG